MYEGVVKSQVRVLSGEKAVDVGVPEKVAMDLIEKQYFKKGG